MKQLWLILLALALLCLAEVSMAASVTLDGKHNIFGAGHLVAPGPGGAVGGGDGGGSLPFEIALPPGTGRTCTFDLAGFVDYGGCCPSVGPDGLDFTGLVPHPQYDGIAGADVPVRAYYVAGVFLDDTEPADPAPDRLTYGDIGFTQTSPGLRQVFFIGDGWTGTGDGTQQIFHIPDGATRLFLGYQDRCSTSPNLPGCYDDNSGTVSGTVTFATVTDAPEHARVRMRLEQNAPNPFNPTTTIAFAVDVAGHYELSIYSASGRRIATVVDEPLEAGAHHRPWNGLRDDGRPVASGVYFYRLVGETGTVERRMVLVK